MNDTTTTTTTDTGRDTGGRFTAGNPGGPGNPFARQTAAVRRLIHESVTAEQVQAIVAAMVDRATSGDVAAAKLVLGYLAGRPGPTPDPDTLDAHDLAVRRKNTVSSEDLKAIFGKLPAGMICDFAAVSAPHIQASLEQKFLELQEKQDQPDQQRRDRKAAPSMPPAPAPQPNPSVADLLRLLPGDVLKPLCEPEVNPVRLVPIPDCKRDKPTGPALATAAQTGHRPKG